jgi:glutaredoxin-related protein
MDVFFQANPGFHSRIGHHLHFPDYSAEELMAIGDLILKQQGYNFDDASKQAFKEYLELRMTQPHFSNARSVRNAIDRAKLRQANRLVKQGGKISVEDLTRLDEADIRQSRVFRGGLDGDKVNEEE